MPPASRSDGRVQGSTEGYSFRARTGPSSASARRPTRRPPGRPRR